MTWLWVCLSIVIYFLGAVVSAFAVAMGWMGEYMDDVQAVLVGLAWPALLPFYVLAAPPYLAYRLGCRYRRRRIHHF